MAGLQPLTALIYLERQQPGSMLCAQHALNNLFQGNYYTAPDLAQIASNYDELELGALSNPSSRSSTNMDDTGFFSVQVMEHALEVMGLNLARWRSEQMRPFHASPYTQLAFILNLNQHWFTLRRFGPANADISRDAGEGHWFNLDSTISEPKWIGRTYLGMVIQQAEEEGYSVFAVCQIDPQGPLALPRTEADNIACSLDPPNSSAQGQPSSSNLMPGSFPEGVGESSVQKIEGLENEDMELQAALHASMFSSPIDNALRAPVPAPILREAPSPPAASTSSIRETVNARSRNSAERVRRSRERASRTSIQISRPRARFASASADNEDEGHRLTGASADAPIDVDEDDDDEVRTTQNDEPILVDPVEASMARSRAMLEQMRRAQEAALAETYDHEIAQLASNRRRTALEEEEEEIRRAIAASMEGVAQEQEQEQEQEAMLVDSEDDKENDRPAESRRPPPRRTDSAAAAAPSFDLPQTANHRVYDDEDADLQAALQASLESAPAGYVHPPSPIPRASVPASSLSSVHPTPVVDTESSPACISPKTARSSDASTEDDDYEEEPSTPPPVEVPVSMDEIRRRRLEKFGG